MNSLTKFTRGVSTAFASVLAFLTLSATGVADASDFDNHQGHGYHGFGFQKVYHNSYKKHKQHSYKKNYGKKYQNYKKHHQKNYYPNKYQYNEHYANKYYYPPGYSKKQFKKKHHHGHFKKEYHYNDQYQYKHKSHKGYLSFKNRNISFKKTYWRAHKRHGYEHKRVKRHHYYYNDKGFYFPNFGFIEHGHEHHKDCEHWHFSPRVATSLLSSIYYK